MSTVFEYLEYRDFLRDFYEDQKGCHAYFSYRYFGKRIGVDASFLVKVLQKQMHLSTKTIPRLITFLKLGIREAEYFELLVSFNKAKKNSDIKLYFEKLLSYRQPYVKTLDAEQYSFFKNWYNIAIYELLTFKPFRGSIQELTQKLNPPISVREAKQALTLLQTLGLITKEKDGTLTVTDKLVTTGEKWRSIAINNFQKSMITLSEEALERFPKKERDISTVTVSLSRGQFEVMKEKIKAMRRELLEMADSEEHADEVFQVNFQIFPLTSSGKKGKV